MFTLKDTIEGMTSPDYKERFCAEYAQIQNRLAGLQNMITKWDNGDLDFTPTCPRATYNFQLKAMREYRDILEVRAAIEDINLEAYLDRIDSPRNDKKLQGR